MADFERNKNFKNWSQSIDANPKRTYSPRNTAEVVAIVKAAHRARKSVRAVGAGWSFTDVMYTDDFLMQTKSLRGVLGFSQGPLSYGPKAGVGIVAGPEKSSILTESLTAAVKRSDRRLVHVRAGTTIKAVIDELAIPATGSPRRPRWALPTMGGASGQTLAGAISTGTHGGDFNKAPIADMVRAMLLVGPDGKLHWIERSGDEAITEQAKVARLGWLRGAELHYDNDWFDAVLVSVGNLGVVCEYVLEVDAQYGISESVFPTTWRDIAPMLKSGEIFESTRYSQRDASKKWVTSHPDAPAKTPLGISVFINPYRMSDNYTSDSNPDRDVALVTHASSSRYSGAHTRSGGMCVLDQFALIAGFEHTNNLGDCRKAIDVILESLRDGGGTEGNYRIAHSVLDSTSNDDRPPVLSIEIVVSTKDGKHVGMVDEILRIFDHKMKADWAAGKQTKFAGGLNLRFTKSTRAMLGMQAPVSGADDERFCHIEVITLREQWATGRPAWGEGNDYRNNNMENYTEEFTDAFERATAKFGARLHWGQLSRTRRHDLDRYPRQRNWLKIKSELTNNGAIKTFETDFSQRHLHLQYDVGIKTNNNHYWVAEGGGGREVLANRTAKRAWETFKMIELGGGKVALRADSGHYLSAVNGGGTVITANATHIRGWEKFSLVSQPDNKYALRAASGHFVAAEGGGGGALVANRPHARAWETFVIEGKPAPFSLLATDLFINPGIVFNFEP